MIIDELNARVVAHLRSAGLDPSLLDDMPYSICSIADFERLTQVVSAAGVNEVMSKKTNSAEFRMWTIGAFLTNHFQTNSHAPSTSFLKHSKKYYPAIPTVVGPAAKRRMRLSSVG